MTDYLLVETGGPACDRFVGDAVRLAAADVGVTLLLLENGVAAAAASRTASPTKRSQAGPPVSTSR